MKQNWRTNLGGAVSVTGTSLIGIGVLGQLSQLSSSVSLSPGQLKAMWYVALTGFVLSCIGKGLAALFSADAKQVQANQQVTQQQISELQLRSNLVPNSIESGDTSVLRKAPITPASAPTPVVPPDVAAAVAKPPSNP